MYILMSDICIVLLVMYIFIVLVMYILQFVSHIDENSGKTFEWQPTKSIFNRLLEISQC